MLFLAANPLRADGTEYPKPLSLAAGEDASSQRHADKNHDSLFSRRMITIMFRSRINRTQRRITTIAQLEALEQRQVLSGVALLSPLPMPTLPAMTLLVGQPPQTTTTNAHPIIPPGNSAVLSAIGSSSLGNLLALPL